MQKYNRNIKMYKCAQTTRYCQRRWCRSPTAELLGANSRPFANAAVAGAAVSLSASTSNLSINLCLLVGLLSVIMFRSASCLVASLRRCLVADRAHSMNEQTS